MDVEQPAAAVAAWPIYLQVLPQYRVALCTIHGCSYTRQGLSRHLLEKHRVKGERQSRIVLSDQVQQQIVTDSAGVVQPADGTDKIPGLPTMHSFLCYLDSCAFCLTSHHFICQHYNREHGWQVSRDSRMPWHKAFVQMLFSQSQSVRYFAVALADQVGPSDTPLQHIYPHANAPDNALSTMAAAAAAPPSPPSLPAAGEDAVDMIMQKFT